MKKFSTLFSAALLAMSSAGYAQTALQEDFSSTTGTALPTGWTQKTKAAKGWFTTTGAYNIYAAAGFTIPAGTGRYAVIDDYNNNEDNDTTGLVTPNINLTGVSNAWMTFNAAFYGAVYTNGTKQEEAFVSASTDGGATWTVLKAIPAVNTGAWHQVAVDLTAYNNAASLKIGFFFSDDKQGQFIGCAVDEIKIYVPPTNEAALTSITNYQKVLTSYGVAGGTKAIGGTIYNNGGTPITSISVSYQLGTNAVVTDVVSGLNITPFTSGNFTSTTALAIPAALGTYPLKMWVKLTGDATATNDSATGSAIAANYMPAKKILFEEGTGAWCGWCPRGAVYMDSIAGLHPGNVSLIAVHDKRSGGDPMAITSYDNFISAKIGNSYPGASVDRSQTIDPSAILDAYAELKDNFGFADITMTDMNAASFGLSIKVSVKPAIDLSGDYRLALALTEDDIHSTDPSYDQHNYYSSTQANRALVGAGYNWQTEGATVNDFHYRFVARAIVPSETGAANSLPATMTAGQTYDYTFNTTVDQPFNRANMKVVAMLLRNSDGAVLNSQTLVMPLGISNIAAGVQHLNVYPNPATDVTHITFNLDENSNVKVQVIDALGRVVNTVNEQRYSAGAQKISVNTANLAAGIYTVKLQTEKGTITQQLSVAK